MKNWQPFARLTVLLVFCLIPFGSGRAQTTPEIGSYRKYSSFAQDLEKLGESDLCTVRSLG